MRVLINAFFAIGWQIAILNRREIKYDFKKFRIIRTSIQHFQFYIAPSRHCSSCCFTPLRIDAVASSNLPTIGSLYFSLIKASYCSTNSLLFSVYMLH